MVCRSSCYAAVLVAFIPLFSTCEKIEEGPPRNRRLEIGVVNSDEYAESVLTAKSAPAIPGIGARDHAKITSILATTREMIDTAKVLVHDERTLERGQEMMEQANSMFREVKGIIREHNDKHMHIAENADHREMLRKKYTEHDIKKAAEADERTLDIARSMYETMIEFPECLGQFHTDCLEIINGDLASLGLSTIEVVTHEKRNENQEGYNKVVIITNELADKVDGRSGDGFVSYPFMWHDSEQGPRMLGVDGKWNCLNLTPEDCCESIKKSVPLPNFEGHYIECHIFVPHGGVGNPRRNDRVFINLSPDGRVHEAPYIA
ncbi:hypothetical protein ACHAXR_005927 [Thalassiosira sp. AJA248-18]